MNLRISDLKDIINILTVTNMGWALELRHNLLTTIYLATKSIKVFLRKTCQFFEIVINNRVFGLADIIKN